MKDSDKKDVSLNWKKIGSIELKRLYEEIQTNSLILNEFGSYIAFCVIDREFETQQMDQNFVKLFKCSQVLIEYLLNEFNRFKSCENEKKSQINLIRENKKLRKLLEIQQKAMTYNRTFNGDNVQCPHCPKIFFDSIFLKTHITRRHPKESLDSEGMLSLTNKINDYQKVLIGDNQNLDKLKDEIHVLTLKLAKTETDLMSERDERIKLEERIEYVMKVRDKEIQQTLKEELEEFKFIQRERDIENVIQINDKNVEKDLRNNCFDEQNPKSLEIHKIEDMIAIQAKEMIKLGNNVQKLVTHLTDNSNEDFKWKQISKTNIDKIKSEESNRDNYQKELQQIKTNKSHSNSVENFSLKESEDMSQEKHKTINYHNRESIKLSDVLNDVQQSLDEKLISFGIDINSDGITEEQYFNAIKKLNVERNLLIQQNRFDYDFTAVEQQIKQFVDKKVDQRIGEPKQESQLLTVPNIKVNDFQTEKKSHLETQKHSVEAIVHSSPLNEPKISDKNIIEDMETNSETIEKSVIQEINLKSVLKPIISESKTLENSEIKVKQKRIRFSEHRIEHQISPEESSEETSEEYGPVVPDCGSFVSDNSLKAPIPAQRTRKTNLTLDLKTNNETNDDSSEDINYEIDDELMDEILQTNSFVKNEDSNERKNVRNQNNSRQTKVQELTEMIEQQLNKRSVSHKRPPIGSVNVMSEYKTKTNGSSVHQKDYDSDSD